MTRSPDTSETIAARPRGPWGQALYRGARVDAMCADGVVRRATITSEADTFFSIPARVSAHGKTVTGFISTGDVCTHCAQSGTSHDFRRDDGSIDFRGPGRCADGARAEIVSSAVTFHAYLYRKNCAVIEPVKLTAWNHPADAATRVLSTEDLRGYFKAGRPTVRDWSRGLVRVDGVVLLIDLRAGLPSLTIVNDRGGMASGREYRIALDVKARLGDRWPMRRLTVRVCDVLAREDDVTADLVARALSLHLAALETS